MARKTKQEPIKYHKQIEQVIDILEELSTAYISATDSQSFYDKKTSDITHAMELDDLSYHEGARLNKDFQDILKKRREAKDTMEVLKHIHFLLKENQSVYFMKQLRSVKNKTASEEKRLSNRQYTKRATQTIIEEVQETDREFEKMKSK